MDASDYLKNVVSYHNGFDAMVSVCGKEIAGKPKKWDMHDLYMSAYRENNFYKVGYVNKCRFRCIYYFIEEAGTKRLYSFTDFQKEYFIWSGKIVHATPTEQEKYRKEYRKCWWCRCNHWRQM